MEHDPNDLPLAAINTLYVGMDNKRRTPANLMIIAQIFRYAIFAIVMVMLQDAPGLQIQILVVCSWFITAIILRLYPYTRTLNFCTALVFEFLYVWSCALALMFSPEYIWRSYEISKNMGFFICMIQFAVLFFSTLLICYSLWWQSRYYRRITKEAMQRAEAAKLRLAARKAKL